MWFWTEWKLYSAYFMQCLCRGQKYYFERRIRLAAKNGTTIQWISFCGSHEKMQSFGPASRRYWMKSTSETQTLASRLRGKSSPMGEILLKENNFVVKVKNWKKFDAIISFFLSLQWQGLGEGPNIAPIRRWKTAHMFSYKEHAGAPCWIHPDENRWSILRILWTCLEKM